MKIVILGAGEVGRSVAEVLVEEGNDVTVVDEDVARLRYVQDRLDLKTVAGSASSPRVLEAAGIEDAEMVLALTGRDEINLVACKLCSTLYRVPSRIARLRSPEFSDRPGLLDEQNFAVHETIVPEQIVTGIIDKLIAVPEALQVLEFAGGALSLVAVRAEPGHPLVGKPLSALAGLLRGVEARVAAIFRGTHAVQPETTTVVSPGDEVFLLARSPDVPAVIGQVHASDEPVRRVLIAGGGNIGFRLARALQDRYQVKLVEVDGARCEEIAPRLSRSLVLRGDATDADLLAEEGVGEIDVFCALTNDDENNIMSSLMAKRLGARKAIAIINRRAYADLLLGGNIDIVLSPAQATIGGLLSHLRRGDCEAGYSLRRGAAEVLELVAHGERGSSRVVGRRIGELDLPAGVTIGALVRNGEPLLVHDDTMIATDDHAIVFLLDKKLIPRVERLFQVGFTFL